MSKEITLEWVVENFLPDYKNRLDLFINNVDIINMYYGNQQGMISVFNHNNFSEALENFAKAQREECAKNAIVDRVVIGHNSTHNEFGYTINYESIVNSHIPKPINK